MIHIEEAALDFDDVLLEPNVSNCTSRDLVDLNMETKHFTLKIPIISSPMVGVSSVPLIVELGKLGGLGILPRFADMSIREKQIRELKHSRQLFGVAIGVRPEIQLKELELVGYALASGANLICIDTANGYLKNVRDFARKLRYIFGTDFALMAGNVVTCVGARELQSSGVDFIRVGIGSGSVCTTRNITGVGSGQLTALQRCSCTNDAFVKEFRGVNIVSDGGIRNSGDAMKAFAFGADFIMLGKLLAQTIESGNEGTLYGMASETNQVNNGHKIKSVEGMNIPIEEKIPLKDFIERFVYGIKSGCTYLGIEKLYDIRYKSLYAQKVNNSIKPWKQEWL
jgi:IMP dehydrogenase